MPDCVTPSEKKYQPVAVLQTERIVVHEIHPFGDPFELDLLRFNVRDRTVAKKQKRRIVIFNNLNVTTAFDLRHCECRISYLSFRAYRQRRDDNFRGAFLYSYHW